MQIMFVSCEDGLILKGNYMFFHVIKSVLFLPLPV